LGEALATQKEQLKKNPDKPYRASEAGPVRLDLVRAPIETVERLENDLSPRMRSIAP
jgi:hypothetical protein